MKKPILRVWTFRSDSDPSTSYQTLQYTDGTTSCDCRGWCRRVAADGSRSCKHTRWVDRGIIVRKLKDVLLEAKTKQKTLIILGCRLVLPPELEREITVVEFALPGKEALSHVLNGIVESAGIKDLSPEHREQAIDAACGLTTIGRLRSGATRPGQRWTYRQRNRSGVRRIVV